MLALAGHHASLTHAIVVALDLLLHVLIGLVLAQVILDRDGWWGGLGGFIPNLDLAFDVWPTVPPLFVHRGLLHTPAFSVVVAGGLLLAGVGRGRVAAFLLGYLAELTLDTVEGHDGVMWFWPASTQHVAVPVPGMQYWVPGGVLIAGVLAVWLWQKKSRTPSDSTEVA